MSEVNNKQLFISHSSADNDIADQIYRFFESKRIACWMDKYDIVPGVPYARAIMEGLEECPAFVVLLSSNSIESDDVLNEIDQAHAYKKLLIPVFLESDLKLPQDFSYYLKRRQWIYFNGCLEKCVDEICEALSSNLGLKFDDSESRDNVAANGSGQCYLLKIKPNEDCMVLVDGDDMGIAEHEKTTKFELRPGEYEVICRCIKTNEEIELDGIVISDKDLLRKPEFKKECVKEERHSIFGSCVEDITSASKQAQAPFGALIPSLLMDTSTKSGNEGTPVLKGACAEESILVGADKPNELAALKNKNGPIADVIALLQSHAKNVLIAEESREEIEQEDVVILDCDILRKPLLSKENQSEIQTHSTSNEQNAKESVDETDKTVGCSESVIVPPTSSESVIKANKDKSENIQKVSGASDVFYDVVLIEQTEKVKGWGEILEEFYVDGMPFDKDWIYVEVLPMMFRYHLSKSDAEQMCASIQKVGFKTEMVVSEIPVVEILKVKSNGKNKIIIESTLSTKYPPVVGFYNADVYCGDLIDEFGAVTYNDGSQRHYTEINLNDISGIPKTCTNFEFEVKIMFHDGFNLPGHKVEVSSKTVKLIINREYNIFSSNKLEIVDYKVY